MAVDWNGVMVYSENGDLALQLVGKGRELADKLGSNLCALVAGQGVEDTQTFINHGSDGVYVADDPALAEFSLEPYRAVLLEAVKTGSPQVLLIGGTKRGKELAPRVAAALDTGCMTDCISLDVDREGRLVGERLVYGGSTVAKEVSHKMPQMATVPPKAFKKPEPAERRGEVVRLDVDLPAPRVNVIERRGKSKGDTGLEDASIIVSAGRGFKEKKDLGLLKELAEVLGAKMGCTRPVAADLGWMNDWIGISGKKVGPKLYIACGISGTIQHAAGIRDAQVIVSINSDESAGIFGISDYGLVGDLYKVVPALTRAFRGRT